MVKKQKFHKFLIDDNKKTCSMKKKIPEIITHAFSY